MHTGRHKLDEQQPVIGSWVHYGLGTLNENLPQFVFLGQYKDARVKKDFAADYLGPQHAGVELSLDPKNPLPFAARGKGVLAEGAGEQFEFVHELNGLAAVEYPDDEQLRARIKAYELAFRMQKAGARGARPRPASRPRRSGSTASTTRRRRSTAGGCSRPAGWPSAACGSRWSTSATTASGTRTTTSRTCTPAVAAPRRQADRRAAQGPEADAGSTRTCMVVCCTEFGRTPGLETRDAYKMPTGRDHHPHGFTVWFAGAGHQARHRPRRDRRARLPRRRARRTTSPTSTRPCSHLPRPRPPPARRPRPQAAGDRPRQRDQGDLHVTRGRSSRSPRSPVFAHGIMEIGDLGFP